MIRRFRRLLSYCITGVISFISYDVGAATRDSSLTKPLRAKTYLYSALSASYATSSNWQGQNLRNFAFVGNVLYKHAAFDSTRSHAHQVIADLGYLKFVDSVWVKSVDKLQVNLLWAANGKRFNHSYSLLLNTQFLPNTAWVTDPETDRTTAKQVGGFMRPFGLEVGYGAVFNFWKGSSINFAFATLKVAGFPKTHCQCVRECHVDAD